MKKRIALLGSTGSIGTQALAVIAANPDFFEVEVLTAHTQADLLIEQAKRHEPNAVVIADSSLYHYVKEGLSGFPDIKVFAGEESLEQVVEMSTVDLVLVALVGFSGVKPTLKAIEAGKNIALANKETLVVAGDLVTQAAYEKNVNIYPVDSEHSAIFQCLIGEFNNPIQQIYLTASGGPFFGKSRQELQHVTAQEALKHPNWTMGKKVTIDSATLMNKGLEVIEAFWLFSVRAEQITVLVHPQSIIHSMVEFLDGSVKAQLGTPNMQLPIQYAFSFPMRLPSTCPRLSLSQYANLTFSPPDTDTFRCLALAYEALRQGGNIACVMNAANEVVVEAFLNHRINFLAIPDVIEAAMQQVDFVAKPTLDDYIHSDQTAREWTLAHLKSLPK